jgi:hypothetical protein
MPETTRGSCHLPPSSVNYAKIKGKKLVYELDLVIKDFLMSVRLS